MCSNKDFFVNRDEQYSGQIKLADREKLKISGIGLCHLKCKLDNQQGKIKVTDVLYLPQLKGNLISVRKLTRNRFNVIFKDESCKIMKGSQVLIDPKLQNGLYELNTPERALMATEDATLLLFDDL